MLGILFNFDIMLENSFSGIKREQIYMYTIWDLFQS